MIAFTGLPGGTEWIIILIVALLIFGKRLPDVMRSMGKSLKQFKKGMEDIDIDDESEEKDKKTDEREDSREKSVTGEPTESETEDKG